MQRGKKAAKPLRQPVERVCGECGVDLGTEGPLPVDHHVGPVRPRTVIKHGPAPWRKYEAIKAELTAQARTSEEYEAAVAEAARRAVV